MGQTIGDTESTDSAADTPVGRAEAIRVTNPEARLIIETGFQSEVPEVVNTLRTYGGVIEDLHEGTSIPPAVDDTLSHAYHMADKLEQANENATVPAFDSETGVTDRDVDTVYQVLRAVGKVLRKKDDDKAANDVGRARRAVKEYFEEEAEWESPPADEDSESDTATENADTTTGADYRYVDPEQVPDRWEIVEGDPGYPCNIALVWKREGALEPASVIEIRTADNRQYAKPFDGFAVVVRDENADGVPDDGMINAQAEYDEYDNFEAAVDRLYEAAEDYPLAETRNATTE
jgi:hypothetical protein